MKASYLLVSCLSVAFLCLAIGAPESASPNSNDSSSSQKKSISLSSDLRSDLGINLGQVEMREFGETDKAVIAVPRSSLVKEGDKTFLFARAEEDEAKFERWEVEIGTETADFVEARTGVFPGDMVAISGVEVLSLIEKGKLQPGSGEPSAVAVANDSISDLKAAEFTVSTETNETDANVASDAATCPLSDGGSSRCSRENAAVSCSFSRGIDWRDCSRSRFGSCPQGRSY